MRLPNPDDVAYVLTLPLVANYWPLLLGGAVMFVLAVKGWNWAMLSSAALFVLLQVWHMGGFD